MQDDAMIYSYWVTFTDDTSACVCDISLGMVIRKAGMLSGKAVKTALSLPYPASPLLGDAPMPIFCFSPSTCAGHTSCPRQLSCTE